MELMTELNAIDTNKAILELRQLNQHAFTQIDELKEQLAHIARCQAEQDAIVADLKAEIARERIKGYELFTIVADLKAQVEELKEFNYHDRRIQELSDKIDQRSYGRIIEDLSSKTTEEQRAILMGQGMAVERHLEYDIPSQTVRVKWE